MGGVHVEGLVLFAIDFCGAVELEPVVGYVAVRSVKLLDVAPLHALAHQRRVLALLSRRANNCCHRYGC
ncbi:MAG: hypothetical protein LIP09_13955 [Bacteroidales bacterium]|nr:hypothetical protein [Bacteroidales bacterium]MCC8119833.1 hypothetical protein [Bacteroidales bacterium]